MGAGFVLRQGRAALSCQRQGIHQLVVGLFAPGIDLQLAAGITLRQEVIFVQQGMLRQVVQRLQRLAAQVFAAYQQPLFERLAVQEKTLQQFAAIQFGSLCQAPGAPGAVLQARVAVRPAFRQQMRKQTGIHLARAGGIELDGLGGDLQAGFRLGIVFPQGGAQTVQRQAQVVVGLLLGQFGPQQTGQGIPPVRAFRFDCQVSQQSAPLIGAEVGYQSIPQADLKWAEQRNYELSHVWKRFGNATAG